MNLHNKISVPRLLTPIALAITLAACSSKPQAPTSVDIALAPSQSAQAYLIQADSTQGSVQNDLLIMALKAAVAEQNWSQAELLAKRLSRMSLSPVQMAEWQLARAQTRAATSSAKFALSQLNYQAWWPLADSQWLAYHQLRAQLFEQTGDHLNAARSLVASNAYLNESEHASNAENIWHNLTQYSEYEISGLIAERSEAELDGWLQLAIYMKTMAGNPGQLKNTLQKWLAENPQHPANLYTPQEIQAILALEIVKPNNTALVLPLSGKYAKQGQLVRDGFIHAMMDDFSREETATLTVLDSEQLSLAELEKELQARGVDFVVGPLQKDEVEELQSATQLPMLALNIPDNPLRDHRVCYLTLSPEQEVAQAAKYLFSQGYQYPLILAPKSRLGERVAIAFQNEWNNYSKNTAAVSYFGNKSQLQKNINQVFGLTDSQGRIAQLEQIIGMETESQARSRRDVDAVYVVGANSDLTLIKPFIEVAINPDSTPPKLFASSRSNSGSKHQYEDLSGVVYSDIPMLINHDSSLNAKIEALWPKSSNSEKRLHALGMDAYRLILELPQMKVVEGYRFAGQTGELSIDEQCVVQREVQWAEHGKN
ncbi:penicillin-binding protein activator [Vibrio sp. SCSIO 43136]|uniref:penicillin-binding protein activator n=1 Tax=Vibrio sp. SCSIO 43136 TaxID=2819101 RepID=UPI0020758A8C|nr:penicillin-binding protein activator [Vibrio sp. SCSIO 43136]USD64873.1 penicillin-binding protein activator [Vibrio sp. SCSIO 43136]